jgi:hypothetical protein
MIPPGTVSGKVLQIEGPHQVTTDSNMISTSGKVPIVKRRRQGLGDEGDIDEHMSEAASHVEGRQSQ